MRIPNTSVPAPVGDMTLRIEAPRSTFRNSSYLSAVIGSKGVFGSGFASVLERQPYDRSSKLKSAPPPVPNPSLYGRKVTE